LSYRLVAFVPAHLPELTDLWIAAWTQAMPAIDFEARRAWLVDHLSELQGQGAAITCAFDPTTGAMAGFITLDLASGHIDQLAAAPSDWGRGAAAELITDAKRHAASRLRLEVNQDNPRAVRFYEKQGFRRRATGVNPTSGLKTWHYEWSTSAAP
jgi:putative acetyltransferase